MAIDIKKKRRLARNFFDERKRCTRVPDAQVAKIAGNYTLEAIGLGYFMTMLNAYPLKPTKARLLETAKNHNIVTGIMISHLFKCARKIEVPQVYIKSASEMKNLRDQAFKLLKNKRLSPGDRTILTKKADAASTVLREELSSLAEATATMIRNRERNYAAMMKWERELDL